MSLVEYLGNHQLLCQSCPHAVCRGNLEADLSKAYDDSLVGPACCSSSYEDNSVTILYLN